MRADQKKIWTSSGMLRIVSMKTVAILLTIQFRDRRAIPTIVPSTVAARMPEAATRSVLTRPA